MTPEAIRIVSQLRGEFYSHFAVGMKVPVKVVSSNSFHIATWVDAKKQLNYLNVYAYTAPDEIFPQRPFLLRVAINRSAGRLTYIRQWQDCQNINQKWDFELTLLPDEILDFIPWIVNLVKFSDKDLPLSVKEPPHLFSFKLSPSGGCDRAWTERAWGIANTEAS